MEEKCYNDSGNGLNVNVQAHNIGKFIKHEAHHDIYILDWKRFVVHRQPSFGIKNTSGALIAGFLQNIGSQVATDDDND